MHRLCCFQYFFLSLSFSNLFRIWWIVIEKNIHGINNQLFIFFVKIEVIQWIANRTVILWLKYIKTNIIYVLKCKNKYLNVLIVVYKIFDNLVGRTLGEIEINDLLLFISIFLYLLFLYLESIFFRRILL